MTTDTDTDLGGACRQFFDAIVARDTDAVNALIADGAVICQNGGVEGPLSMLGDLAMLEATEKLIGKHRYEDIRQVVGVRSVAEQHRVRATMPTGAEMDQDVCAVLQFDADGRITRLDEYVDTAPFLPGT